MMLNAPIPGRESQVSPVQAEAEGEAFMSFMAQHEALTGAEG